MYIISSLVNQDSKPEDVSVIITRAGVSSTCSVEITLFIIITDVNIIITITTNSTTFITISIILKRWNHVCTIPYKV